MSVLFATSLSPLAACTRRASRRVGFPQRRLHALVQPPETPTTPNCAATARAARPRRCTCAGAARCRPCSRVAAVGLRLSAVVEETGLSLQLQVRSRAATAD
eukprot:5425824-Pleurochrysis_carterae.AAC.4